MVEIQSEDDTFTEKMGDRAKYDVRARYPLYLQMCDEEANNLKARIERRNELDSFSLYNDYLIILRTMYRTLCCLLTDEENNKIKSKIDAILFYMKNDKDVIHDLRINKYPILLSDLMEELHIEINKSRRKCGLITPTESLEEKPFGND